jgi:hypothetical protein
MQIEQECTDIRKDILTISQYLSLRTFDIDFEKIDVLFGQNVTELHTRNLARDPGGCSRHSRDCA